MSARGGEIGKKTIGKERSRAGRQERKEEMLDDFFVSVHTRFADAHKADFVRTQNLKAAFEIVDGSKLRIGIPIHSKLNMPT
jgi:hypothetical protein